MDADRHSPNAPEIGADSLTVSAIVLRELRGQLAAWHQHEPGARLGSDPEALHQLRVAVRRIEAMLSVFRRQLSPALTRARSATKGVLRTLGTVRDFDVQLAQLDARCTRLGAKDRAAALPLRQRLEQERERARSQLLRALDAEPVRQWLATLEQATTDGAGVGPETAVSVVPARVRRRFRKLKRAVQTINGRSTMERFHTVRRRAKQLRYALECAATLCGKPSASMLKALRALQDELGAHQDAEMAARRLTQLAARAEGLPARTLFLMGRLVEHDLVDTAAARKTLERGWRKVRKRWRPLRARLQALAAPAEPTAPLAPEPDPPAVPPSDDSFGELTPLQAVRH
ncbi:MAG: CHAD domain-containing protein [Gammaproteobacteria bacterium]|nr:CHAD domain-containing protein [Gammaproteobacteria bacterium]MBV9621515.1 CHAD domain-containing protein [Gammaproteobacteria bacterium]